MKKIFNIVASLVLILGLIGVGINADETTGNDEATNPQAAESENQTNDTVENSEEITKDDNTVVSVSSDEVEEKNDTTSNDSPKVETTTPSRAKASGIAIDVAHFPDENLRNYISSHFDSDNNGYLSDEEVNNAKALGGTTNETNFFQYQPKNLNGIEYLTSLETIDIDSRYMDGVNIDLSKNTNLKTVRIVHGLRTYDRDKFLNSTGGIDSINLTGCNKLEALELFGNNLKELDVRGKSNLHYINVANNHLTELNLSGVNGSGSRYFLTVYAWLNNFVTPKGITVTKDIDFWGTENIVYGEYTKVNDNKYVVNLRDLGIEQKYYSSLEIKNETIYTDLVNKVDTGVIDETTGIVTFNTEPSVFVIGYNTANNHEWPVNDDFNCFGNSTVFLTRRINSYNVKFVDGLGNTLSSQEVEEGKAAVAPTDPTRENYTFTGWDKDFSNVTESMVVTAQWQKVVNNPSYKVSANDTSIKQSEAKAIKDKKELITLMNATLIENRSRAGISNNDLNVTCEDFDKIRAGVLGSYNVTFEYAGVSITKTLTVSPDSTVTKPNTNLVVTNKPNNASATQNSGLVNTGDTTNVIALISLIGLAGLILVITKKKLSK